MNEPWYIAVEAGATRSRAALFSPTLQCVLEKEGEPCNPVAYGVTACVRNLTQLLRPILERCTGKSCQLLLGTAGAAELALRQELGKALMQHLPFTELRLSTDLHPVLLANAPEQAAILVVAGTGSAVLGKDEDGGFLKLGGRGVLFGDVGSAHQLAVEGLRAGAQAVDGLGHPSVLGARFPEHFGGISWEAIVVQTGSYSKDRLAKLARIVIDAAEVGDTVARETVMRQAQGLADLVKTARQRLGKEEDAIPVFGQGALLLYDSLFRKAFEEALKTHGIQQLQRLRVNGPESMLSMRTLPEGNSWMSIISREEACKEREPVGNSSPTESVSSDHPLDSLSTPAMVARMHSADEEAVAAVGACHHEITALIEATAKRFDAGGRIVYTGAGTSGRLGVLDASECPPTFGVPPEWVVGLMAGGDKALRYGVEGAEDDEALGRNDVMALQPSANDSVIGLAASGNTPYVHAALRAAKAEGALTALVCCNPNIDRQAFSPYIDHLICLNTGPEILAGSTRLKAGTATKLVLNRLSTGVMALHGLIFEGRMVGMLPQNKKLRRRAVQMVADLGLCSLDKAEELLERTGYHIALAVLMARQNWELETARERLQAARGKLRQALG